MCRDPSPPLSLTVHACCISLVSSLSLYKCTLFHAVGFCCHSTLWFSHFYLSSTECVSSATTLTLSPMDKSPAISVTAAAANNTLLVTRRTPLSSEPKTKRCFIVDRRVIDTRGPRVVHEMSPVRCGSSEKCAEIQRPVQILVFGLNIVSES